MEVAKHVRLIFFASLFFTIYFWAESRAYSSEFSFFINYTVNDGLPSSKVYDIIQDGKGYIWFATENGVSRFDGYGFTSFTVEDGLPTNSTLGIYEDYKGRLWFLSYLGPISYYENGKIYAHPINDSLKKLNVSFFTDIFVDSLDNLLLTKFYGGYLTISNNKVITKNLISEEKEIHKDIRIVKKSDKLIGWRTNLQTLKVLEKENITDINDTISILHTCPPTEHHLSYCISGECTFISFGLNLFIIKNGILVSKRHFDNEIVGLCCDIDGGLWVNEKFNGAKKIDVAIESMVGKTFLEGKTVSKVIQTRNGNYWFSTTEDGVYFVPSIQFNVYNSVIPELEKENILSLSGFGSRLYFSTTGKGLYKADIKNQILNSISILKFDSDIINNFNDILTVSENEIFVPGNLYKFPGKKNGFSFPINDSTKVNFLKHGYSVTNSLNNRKIVCNLGGIQTYYNSNLVYSSKADSFFIKTFSVLEMPDSSLILGTIEGLYSFKDGKYNKIARGNKVLEKRISTLNFTNRDIWVGTFDNGIAIIGENGIRYISTKEGLSSNRIKAVFAENDSTIWVGTNKGINKILISDSIISKIIIYSIWDGLPSNEINDILGYDGYLWLATQKGLVSFDPAIITKSGLPPVLIVEKIKVNGSDTSFMAPNPKLRYFQNSISFQFKGISYYNPGSIDYYYKLEGIDDEWMHTRGTSLQFPDLSHGNYRFVLKAKNAAGIMGLPYSFDFTIQKHFSETIVFKVFTFVFFAAFIIFIFLFILSRQKKRDELKRRVLVSEQRALRSQMNPHFIFNSLNSIHDIVINNKTGASKFIVDFSMLLRRILELSKYNTVSLSDELKTIELYLSLEKNRLSDRFDYGIFIDNTINTEFVKIPSMIIQPMVENAIWHGIAPLPSQTKGYISISIKHVDNKTSIIITDDGIGRKKASKIEEAKDYRKSTGLGNINERIKLAKRIYKTEIVLQIGDLFVDRENTGTKAEITFGVIN